MKGKIVVVEGRAVVVVVSNGSCDLSFEFIMGDGMVLRNDNATWHVISTELPNL